MKICREHSIILRRGMTYQLVSSKECEVCKLLDRYED